MQNLNTRLKVGLSILSSIIMLFGLFAGATPASALTCNSATITGTVFAGTPPTTAWFEYSHNYTRVANGDGNKTPVQTFYTKGIFPMEYFLSGRKENTTYYYRIAVNNVFGTNYGSIKSFTTPFCNNPPPPVQNPTVDLTADQSSVPFNGNTTIRWNSNNATSCTASGGANGWANPSQKALFGSFFTGNLTNTVTYHITCSNSSGSASDSVTVSVGSQPPPPQNPTVQIFANPSSVAFGGSSTITWNSSNATSCSASGGANGWAGGTSLFGSFFTGNLTNTVTYHITCSNSSGSASDSVTVSVGSQPPPPQNPTVSLTADDLNIDFNDSTILRWSSNNANFCTGSGGINGWAGSKSLSSSFNTGALTSTRTYTITCSNDTGSASDSVTIQVDDERDEDEPTVDIRADDTTVDFEDSTIVRWTSENADSCRGTGGTNGWAGSLSRSGSFRTGDLTDDETFRITCTNDFGSDNDSVTIRVEDEDDDDEDRPTVNIFANPSSVSFNGTSTITWNSDNADSCRTSGGTSGWSGTRSRSGSFFTGNLTNTTTYTIRCTNENGSATDSTTVSVGGNVPINNQPTVVIFADSTNIAFNSSTTVRWNTTNATSCFASGGSVGWAGAKSIGPGSFFTGSLTGARTYTITCSNDVGSSTDSVTVNVRGQVLGVSTPPSSLVLISSSIDRNQPIVPTLDNTNPCPGDEINYTLTYQNIGTASITNLNLRIDLPLEVDYMFSNPNNPIVSGNTLIFNLGTLRANGQGTVTVRVRVRNNVPAGANLNFPAILSYITAGFPQSVSANVSARVCGMAEVAFAANVFGAGFLPDSILGWLLLLILILILILLAKYLFGQSFQKRTITTYEEPLGKTTTTTIHQ